MKSKLDSYSISTLAHLFHLSRSTLLYYDRIGLLPSSVRTDQGYRLYLAADRDQLERICHFREAGLSLHDIHLLLVSTGEPSCEVLERRYQEIGHEMQALKAKRNRLDHMLKGLASNKFPPTVDKDIWVEMLRAAGLDDQAMGHWHGEFEARAPEAHHDFLLSLGIPEKDVLAIRKWSKETLGKGQKEATQRKSAGKQRKTSR